MLSKFSISLRRSILLTTQRRLFSTQKEEPPKAQEYIVNEKEIFSEEKMQEARNSIKEKLRQISQQEEQHKSAAPRHDPKDFEFTNHHRIG